MVNVFVVTQLFNVAFTVITAVCTDAVVFNAVKELMVPVLPLAEIPMVVLSLVQEIVAPGLEKVKGPTVVPGQTF
ncbi:MAG: hypothetical protein EOO12_01420 [Chitinophagaceae bacterium]|nr:MAG: hypothetical protein EOO12_01420 [Chitinophagaceae bacterium]